MEDPFQNGKPQPSDGSAPQGSKRFILWVILGGIFIIAVIGIISYYFFWQFRTKDQLINFVPIDAVAYVHLGESVWPSEKLSLVDYPLTEVYQTPKAADYFTDIDVGKELLPTSRQAAWALLPRENSLDIIYLFLLKDPGNLNSVTVRLPHYQLIAEDILLVSVNQQSLDRVKEVMAGRTFSLAAKADLQKKVSGQVQVYVDSNNLNNFFLNQGGQPLNKTFAQLIDQNIYISLRKINNQWQFKINDFLDQPQNVRPPLVDYLPNNFRVYISSINLDEVFKDWSEAETNFSEFFKQAAVSFNNIYNFDLKQAAGLLKSNVDLIIFDNKNNNPFNFDYLLVLPKQSSDQLKSFEDFIRIILAIKLPKPVPYLLPDGTTVTEFLAQPDAWQWQKETIDNQELWYLQEPQLNFEISYLSLEDKTLIASTKDLLKFYLDNRDIALVDLIASCRPGDQYLLINNLDGQNINLPYLPEGLIFASQKGNKIQGCILDIK